MLAFAALLGACGLALLSLAGAVRVEDIVSQYEGLYGEGLRAALRKDYAEHEDLGYEQARVWLYTDVYNHDDVVEGIYSGHKMSCSHTSTKPGCNEDLNCEHLIPQSFFDKKTPMKSDMHHLRPSYEPVNSARSNYGFDEIPDEQVDHWYRDTAKVESAPSEPGEWSRLDSKTAWEPRDAAKGDVVRSIAYFFTMYPDYFDQLHRAIDVDVMLDWNQRFQPTLKEVIENEKIQSHQGNYNPYVLDWELMARAYCDQSSQGCDEYRDQ